MIAIFPFCQKHQRALSIFSNLLWLGQLGKLDEAFDPHQEDGCDLLQEPQDLVIRIVVLGQHPSIPQGFEYLLDRPLDHLSAEEMYS